MRGRSITPAAGGRCDTQMEVSEMDQFLPILLDVPEVLCLAD